MLRDPDALLRFLLIVLLAVAFAVMVAGFTLVYERDF